MVECIKRYRTTSSFRMRGFGNPLRNEKEKENSNSPACLEIETLLRLPATAKISKKPLVTASSPKSRSEKKVINQRQIILKTDSTLPLQCARTVKTYKYPVMTTNKLSKVGSASSITKGTMFQLR